MWNLLLGHSQLSCLYCLHYNTLCYIPSGWVQGCKYWDYVCCIGEFDLSPMSLLHWHYTFFSQFCPQQQFCFNTNSLPPLTLPSAPLIPPNSPPPQLMYGYCSIPFVYFLSLAFSSPVTAFSIIAVGTFISGWVNNLFFNLKHKVVCLRICLILNNSFCMSTIQLWSFIGCWSIMSTLTLLSPITIRDLPIPLKISQKKSEIYY